MVGSHYDATILYDGKGIHLKPLIPTNDNTKKIIVRSKAIHKRKQTTISLGVMHMKFTVD